MGGSWGLQQDQDAEVLGASGGGCWALSGQLLLCPPSPCPPCLPPRDLHSLIPCARSTAWPKCFPYRWTCSSHVLFAENRTSLLEWHKHEEYLEWIYSLVPPWKTISWVLQLKSPRLPCHQSFLRPNWSDKSMHPESFQYFLFYFFLFFISPLS